MIQYYPRSTSDRSCSGRASFQYLTSAAGDPFLAEGLFPRKPKSMADVEGVIGASNNPHPRGSLFDDDEVFGNEESVNSQEAVANRDRGHLTGSGSLEPSPHRVVSVLRGICSKR